MAAAESGSTDVSERLRARVAETPLYQDLGIELLDVAPGRATAALAVVARHCNIDGVLQGGLYAVVADTAMGCAARTRQDIQSRNKTLTLEVDYHDSVPAGQRLVAEARVVHSAGRLTWVEATLAVLTRQESSVGVARSLNYEVSAR